MRPILFIVLLLIVSLSYALVVNHIPLGGFNPEQNTELRTEVLQGMDEILEALVMYRQQGSELFNQIRMEQDTFQDLWLKGSLPLPAVPELGYEYYFKFTLSSGAVETLPAIEPEMNPYVILPQAKAGELSQDFFLLSDEPAVYAKDGLVVAVSWFALEGEVKTETIKLFINGRDVSQRAHVTRNMLIYKDANPKSGILNIFVTAKTLTGKEIYSPTWTKVIKPSGTRTNLPLNLRGSFNAGTNVLSTSKDSSADTFGSDRDDGWTSLDMYAEHNKLRLQSYTYLSTLQNENEQHINRFRMGILLPFWDTYIGDYAPSMSSLTMNNRSIRGIYTKLHSSNFAFSVAHGEMVRNIAGNASNDNKTKEDQFTPGVFKQEAFATRIELGNDDGFLMGLTTTRNRDIVSSLDYDYIFRKSGADTTQWVFPQDNLVISMDTRIAIPQINLVMGAEGAISLYNSNTYPGPFNSDDLAEYLDMDEDEEVPFNPADFQDIFIINTNMQPLPMSDDFSDFSPFIAWQAYLRNFYKNNLLNFSISRVGASYKALSTNYMQSDATQIMLSDQFTYLQYLFVSGGFSQITDNFSKSNLDTNKYNNFFAQGMLRLPRLPYLLLAFTNSKGENERNTEIDLSEPSMFTPYKRSGNMFSLNLGYDVDMIPVAPTTVDVGWRRSVNNEKREEAFKAFVKFYEFDTNNFSLSLTSRFIELPLKTQFGISNNTQKNTVLNEKNSYFNFFMRGDYSLPFYRIVPWAEYKLTNLSGIQPHQNINYLALGVDARPYVNTSVSTSLGWHIYGNKDISDADYTTTIWHLNLSQRF